MKWGDIKRWQPQAIGTVGDGLVKARKIIQGQQAQLDDAATLREWSSRAGGAAKRKLNDLNQELETYVAGLAALIAAVDRCADAATALQRTVGDAEELAGRYDFTITDGGTVQTVAGADVSTQSDEVAARQKVKAELEDTVAQVMRRAEDLDDDLGTVLKKAKSGDISDGGAGDLAAASDAGTEQGTRAMNAPPPPDGGSPTDNKAWWDTLTKSERQWYITNEPGLIGSTDGVPAKDRHDANVTRLETKLEQLRAEAKELEKKLYETGDPQQYNARLQEVQGKLKGLENIEKRIESTEGQPPEQRHYLLDVQHSDNGQAIVAKGNPDQATNTATYVPGTGGGLEGINGDLDRMDKMHRAADQAGSDNTSVVTWMGYQAPQDIGEAMQEKYAEGAEDDLASFQEGLRATHEGPPSTNTLVGHSYGSTATGHTLRDNPGLDVDQAVMVGSPGTGVDHVDDLHIGAENVYATTAENDIIRGAPSEIHNEQPISDDYGAQTFASDPGTEGSWYTGGRSLDAHSEYWDPDNKALDNMGRIIAGGAPR